MPRLAPMPPSSAARPCRSCSMRRHRPTTYKRPASSCLGPPSGLSSPFLFYTEHQRAQEPSAQARAPNAARSAADAALTVPAGPRPSFPNPPRHAVSQPTRKHSPQLIAPLHHQSLRNQLLPRIRPKAAAGVAPSPSVSPRSITRLKNTPTPPCTFPHHPLRLPLSPAAPPRRALCAAHGARRQPASVFLLPDQLHSATVVPPPPSPAAASSPQHRPGHDATTTRMIDPPWFRFSHLRPPSSPRAPPFSPTRATPWLPLFPSLL